MRHRLGMNVVGLFSGAGGIELGLQRAGMTIAATCEIEPYARAVLKKRFPDAVQYDDVRELGPDRLVRDGVRCDVLAAGFPCQDLSLAGKGAGLDGARSGLFFEVIRLAREIRPGFILLENVSALLSRGLGRVLGALAEIGYDAEWHCIPARHAGAPHGRDRIWIVAYPQRDEQPRQEPRLGTLGRMGREQQSFPWDRTWQDTLSALRGMDDGFSRSVDRTDLCRNAVVPQIPQALGEAMMEVGL